MPVRAKGAQSEKDPIYLKKERHEFLIVASRVELIINSIYKKYRLMI